MKTISFIVQLDHEADPDHCRYALVTADAGLLRARASGLDMLRRSDPGIRSMVFDDGIVESHVVARCFPVSEESLEEGETCPLSAEEQAALDSEGWSVLRPSVVSDVPVSYAGFEDDVREVRLVVSELGLSFWAWWDAGESGLARSWTIGWEILDAAADVAQAMSA